MSQLDAKNAPAEAKDAPAFDFIGDEYRRQMLERKALKAARNAEISAITDGVLNVTKMTNIPGHRSFYWDIERPDEPHVYAIYGAETDSFTYIPDYGRSPTNPIYLTCREGHVSLGSVGGLRACKARDPTFDRWCPVCAEVDPAAAGRELARTVAGRTGLLPEVSGIVAGYLPAPEAFAATLAAPPSGLRFAYLIEWLSREDAAVQERFALLATPMSNIDAMLPYNRPKYELSDNWSYKFRGVLKFLTECARKARCRQFAAAHAESKFWGGEGGRVSFQQYLGRVSSANNALVGIAIAEPWFRLEKHNSMAYTCKEIERLEKSDFEVKMFGSLVAELMDRLPERNRTIGNAYRGLATAGPEVYYAAAGAALPYLSRGTLRNLYGRYRSWAHANGFSPIDYDLDARR